TQITQGVGTRYRRAVAVGLRWAQKHSHREEGRRVVTTSPHPVSAGYAEPASSKADGPSRPASDTIIPVVTTLAVGLFLIGTAWDVQWHRSIGRDRLFTMPHVLMLAGIALAGLVSLVALLAEAWRFRRTGAIACLFTAASERVGAAISGAGAALA